MNLKGKTLNAANSLKNGIYDCSYMLVNKVVFTPTKHILSTVFFLLEQSFIKAKTTGEKLLLFSVLITSLIWISIISYASFYNLYLPAAEISRPVYLGFSACPGGNRVCSFPAANISLTEQNHIKEVLGSGQIYSIVVDLELPDSPVNRDVGMFMVVIHMYDRFHHVSASSKRMAMLKYKSLPMRLINFAIKSPFFLFDILDETQHISLEMFSSFTDDVHRPSVGATVEIQNQEIQIYSCVLNIYAKFSGLKYILYYWPVTSAVFGVLFNITGFFIFFSFALINKRNDLKEITSSLSQEISLVKQNEEERDKLEKIDSNDKNTNKSTQGTQTRLKEEDLPFSLPLVQEPADFDHTDSDLDLMTELRQRRLQ